LQLATVCKGKISKSKSIEQEEISSILTLTLKTDSARPLLNRFLQKHFLKTQTLAVFPHSRSHTHSDFDCKSRVC